MFGFLRSTSNEPAYRQAYSRCCSFQHLLTGVSSLPFLSYESIFLYQFAVDAGFSPGPPPETKNCCRMQTSESLRGADDFAIGEFCVRFGLLLAAIKIEDDVRDGGSMIAKLANWKYRAAFEASFAYFEQFDREFEQNVRRIIGEHIELEKAGAVVPLHQYVGPTANAFGYVFSQLAELFADRQLNSAAEIDFRETLRLVGEHIGAAIISFDCAVDYQKDQWNGDFNPLREAADVNAALDYCGDQLVAAGWKCREIFGDQSRTVQLLRNRFDSLCGYYHRCQRPPIQSWLERWGLIRQPGHAYARCDAGCCEVFAACGACGEVGGACGGEGAACLGCSSDAPVCFCFCPECVDECLCADRQRRAREQRDAERTELPVSELIGEIGVAQTALRPSGTVSVNGQRIPAKSEDVFINGVEKVVIVREDAFGAVVRRVSPSG